MTDAVSSSNVGKKDAEGALGEKGFSCSGDAESSAANPTSPPPSKARRPGSGMTEDRTTAGAAKEFVARIRTSRKTGPNFRTVKLLSPVAGRKPASNPVDFHN